MLKVVCEFFGCQRHDIVCVSLSLLKLDILNQSELSIVMGVCEPIRRQNNDVIDWLSITLGNGMSIPMPSLPKCKILFGNRDQTIHGVFL